MSLNITFYFKIDTIMDTFKLIKLHLLLVALLTTTVFNCSCLYSQNSFCSSTVPTAISQIKNIHYSDTLIDPFACRHVLDVYYPTPKLGKMPLIVLIHGGSFINNDKSDLSNLAKELAKKNYIVANINYRLGWDFDIDGQEEFTACTIQEDSTGFGCVIASAENQSQAKAIYSAVQDANAAIRFLVNNSSDPNTLYNPSFQVNRNMIFVGGHSAGAAVALQVAYMDQIEANDWGTNLGDPALFTALGNLDTPTFYPTSTIYLTGGI